MGARYDFPIPFGWYAVSLSRDLAAGEVRPLRYFGKDLVLFRTESGEAKLLDAFCPHLGAHLGHGGRVKGEHIACPFHAWEFSGEGVCRHIPYAKAIPPRADGKQTIHAYPTVERNQVVWAWYHPARSAPTFEVELVPEVGSAEWTDYRLYEWTVDTIIQEAAENAADAAHFLYVHSARDIPRGEVRLEGHRRFARYAGQTPDMDEHGNIDQTGTKWRESRLETSNNGPGQTLQRFMGLFDTIQLGLVTPIDDESFHLRFCFIQKRDMNPAQQAMAKVLTDEISRQVEQDIPIWNHKVYQPQPILCDGDGPIAQFRRWFSQFYAPSAGGDTLQVRAAS
jgi:phenylpropionate dioxygenase-like ring-hydroxylating dioxygenase large terminal subunit